ncbi:ABC transporter permease [Flaviaesturariibacter aridisoli]|uniref:Redoxin domain-containing protein n=1 Tax=Flaviaesturariibacter aridisoli TaxID=2545761 RepID=A0A4R4E5C1_9BACT|nr:ABC transporter permease [Flaviaesturariibacter aridisoli]TCZ72825.1 redoxin domain-containing protein [Flaviaesturariibacter aridisoli]
MRLFFATHGACFRAEWIKLKRTGLFWMGLGSALFIPAIQTIAQFFIHPSQGGNVWNSFLEHCLTGFTAFFYPLFLCITMLRLVYLEHKADTWKVLETQPVSRLALFGVKYEVALLVAALSLLALVACAIGGGALVQVLRPEMNFQKSTIHWSLLGGALLRFWIASFGILALQYYLSLLIKNFGWPMTISLVAVIAGGVPAGFGIWPWFPWSATNLTGAAYKGNPRGGLLLPHEWLSLLWAALFLVLGYQLLTQRRFAAAHVRGRRGLATGLGIVVFAVAVWAINQPRIADRYDSTVLSGTFQTKKPLRTVAFVRQPFNDTQAVAFLNGGAFRLRLPDTLPVGFYELQAGSHAIRIFFGGRDSLHVAVEEKEQSADLSFGGTRVAENEFLQRNTQPDFSYITQFFGNAGPAAFGSQLANAVESEERDLAQFHTVDNVGVAPDFVTAYSRIIRLAALQLTEIEYPKSFALYHPNETLKYPKRIEELRNSLSNNDPALLPVPGYLSYLGELLRLRSARSANRDSAFRAESARLLQRPELREALALQVARERMRRIPDTAARAAFVQAALADVQEPRYRRLLQQDLMQLNSLMRGRRAPDFASEGSNNSVFSLEQFHGRYVVLDVWATWCGPCRKESPYFEDMAERYTDEKLLFVAVSVDEEKAAWQREARFRSSRVLQLHVPDAMEQFLKPYSIETIPRFLLIGPDGRILNAFMPPPSDPGFASILQREIPFVSHY